MMAAMIRCTSMVTWEQLQDHVEKYSSLTKVKVGARRQRLAPAGQWMVVFVLDALLCDERSAAAVSFACSGYQRV